MQNSIFALIRDHGYMPDQIHADRLMGALNDGARSTDHCPERAPKIGSGIRTRGGLAPAPEYQSGALNQLSHPSILLRNRRFWQALLLA